MIGLPLLISGDRSKMVGRGGGMMQSLEAVLRRVAGIGESSQTAGERTRRRGEASSSVPPPAEDAGTSWMTRRSSRRKRGHRARSPSSEEEEEPLQQQEEDQEEEEEATGDTRVVWLRGPLQLPIPLARCPMIRPVPDR